MSLLASLFLYPSTVLLGYLLATLMQVKNHWERGAVGWLLGSTLTTYLYFLLHDTLGISFTALSLSGLLLGLILILGILVYIRQPFTIKQVRHQLKLHTDRWLRIVNEKSTLVLILLVFVPILFGIMLNLRWPVMDWDALALYDYRAKVFSMSGGIADGIPRGYFLHYPLYTSMLHTFSYLYGIQSARIWYSLFYIASLVVFYELLQRHVSQKQALFGAFVLAIAPQIFQHSQMTYTNLSHALYLALGYIYFWEWWRTGKKIDLWLGATLIAASTWVRLTEPFWIPAFGMLLLGGWRWRQQFRHILLAGLVIYFFRYPWIQYVIRHDNLSITNPLQIGGGLQLSSNPIVHLIRIQEVYTFFWISVFPVIGTYATPLVIAGLYLLYQEKWQELIEYGFFLLLILFICAGIYLFSFQFEGWKLIPDSAARMSMFLIPLAIYLLMKSKLWLIPRKES